MPAATTTESLVQTKLTVTVAPLVLLSVVDHYNRTVKGTRKRVVGVLLGQTSGSIIRVTNSFAVPFEEDDRDASVWFLDHNYIELMNDMFKTINAREKLVGWYHTGPKRHSADLEISDLFKRYTPNPLLVVVDVHLRSINVPTDAYFAVEEIKDDGSTTARTFVHTPSVIEAEEAEEIGVEHLLRDIRDAAVGTLSSRLTQQLQSLKGLHHRLNEIATYLSKVVTGELPVNHVILNKLQDMFNLLPNLSTPSAISPHLKSSSPGAPSAESEQATSELMRAFTVKTNDELMTVYLSSLIRAIIAFHDLIENKVEQSV
ncbi:maintenance of mitochondrial structure and function-domain-containing protein [Limtongia smithiae]|uniref:maintenance of mitochondrial structure and function-domain-containing protein n=1 Tax=Limtongia smithiae TaxID=1125753 RepID=UPI0034CF2FDB